MKINKKEIEKAIKKLQLKNEELDIISLGNMEKICEIANCNLMEVMYYLRFER